MLLEMTLELLIQKINSNSNSTDVAFAGVPFVTGNARNNDSSASYLNNYVFNYAYWN